MKTSKNYTFCLSYTWSEEAYSLTNEKFKNLKIAGGLIFPSLLAKEKVAILVKGVHEELGL